MNKFISEHCHGIILNANDTFGYACSEECVVDTPDIPKLMEMYEKYGISGIDAMMAKIMDCDVISPRRSKEYKLARKELKEYSLFENMNLENEEQKEQWRNSYRRWTGED